MQTPHHMKRMSEVPHKIGDTVTVTLPWNNQETSYVEDGRACQIVRLENLQHGDEILGWYGEEFTFGTVDHVEKFPVASYGPAGPSYRWVVHTTDGRVGNPLVNPDSPRRIARRTL